MRLEVGWNLPEGVVPRTKHQKTYWLNGIKWSYKALADLVGLEERTVREKSKTFRSDKEFIQWIEMASKAKPVARIKEVGLVRVSREGYFSSFEEAERCLGWKEGLAEELCINKISFRQNRVKVFRVPQSRGELLGLIRRVRGVDIDDVRILLGKCLVAMYEIEKGNHKRVLDVEWAYLDTCEVTSEFIGLCRDIDVLRDFVTELNDKKYGRED